MVNNLARHNIYQQIRTFIINIEIIFCFPGEIYFEIKVFQSFTDILSTTIDLTVISDVGASLCVIKVNNNLRLLIPGRIFIYRKYFLLKM